MTKSAKPLFASVIKESDLQPRIVPFEVYKDTLAERIGELQRADSILTNVYAGSPEITQSTVIPPHVEVEDVKNVGETPFTVATIDAFSRPIDFSGAREQVTEVSQDVAATNIEQALTQQDPAFADTMARLNAKLAEVKAPAETILTETTSETDMAAQQLKYVDALSVAAARGKVAAAFQDTLPYEDMPQKDFGIAGN